MNFAISPIAAAPFGGIPVTRSTRSLKDYKRNPSTDPLLELYDVEIDEATTLHFVRGEPLGKRTVDVKGIQYTSTGIEREEIKENLDGDLFSTRLAVSNIDGLAGAYIELNDLEGKSVKHTVTPYSLRNSKSPNDRASLTFTIQDQSYNRRSAVFTLGHADYLRRSLPWRRFGRLRCTHAYHNRFLETSPCFYPSDRFGADTSQDFALGAEVDTERVRLHGWRALNSTRALSFDVDKTVDDHLVITAEDDVVAKEWLDAARDGPFSYKELAGDFDVWTQLPLAIWRGGMIAGILVEDPTAEDDWLLFGLELAGTQHRAVTRVTSSDVSTTYTQDVGAGHNYLRVRRTGLNLETYYSSLRNAEWTLHRTEVLSMASQRIGLCLSLSAAASSFAQATFPFFHFTAGGLGTCDLTLTGANGCRAHGNTAHHLGFVSSPRR